MTKLDVCVMLNEVFDKLDDALFEQDLTMKNAKVQIAKHKVMKIQEAIIEDSKKELLNRNK